MRPAISVRMELVREEIVDPLVEEALRRSDEELPREVDRALARAGPLARAGYLARVVEWKRFERAREPSAELAERLRARMCPYGDPHAVAAELSDELARAEPPERPDPNDARAMTWRIAGPGGHVRHHAALATAERLGGPSAPDAAKRDWLYGFFLRCCEEALDAAPPPAA